MKCSSFTTGLNELGTPRYKEFQIDETGIQFFWANIYFVDRFLIKSEMSFQGYLRTYLPIVTLSMGVCPRWVGKISTKSNSNKIKICGRWLWLSWQSGGFRFQRSRFKSSHWENLIMNIFNVNCWKDKNK